MEGFFGVGRGLRLRRHSVTGLGGFIFFSKAGWINRFFGPASYDFLVIRYCIWAGL